MKLRRFLTTKLLATIVLAGLLSGCGDDDAPQVVQQQPAPAPVQQQVEQQPQVVYVQPDQQQAPQVVYEQAPQQQAPVIVNQQPQYDSTGHLINTLVAAHMVNNLLGNNGGRGDYSSNRTTVNKTVINKTYVKQAPQRQSFYGSQGVRTRPVPTVRSQSFSAPRSYSSKPLKISTSKPSYYKSRRR